MIKRAMALALTLALFWTVVSAMASNTPGSAADPLVTLSYMRDKFTPLITDEAVKRTNAALDAKNTLLNALLGSGRAGLYAEKFVTDAFIGSVNAKVSQLFTATGNKYTKLSAASDRTLTLMQGSSVVLISGSAALKNAAVNLTAGADIAAGTAIPPNSEIIFADSGGIVTFTSASELLVCGKYSLTAVVYTPKYTDLANALQEMGLLRGTGSGFALNRAATRTEALYMMLYLLGEIDEAEAYTGTSPFTDVPEWAEAVVAYAYNKGYTKGTSAASFGSSSTSTPAQYVTMLLRIMGYDDSNGDFQWENSTAFAVSKGILTTSEQTGLDKLFYRDQMVYVSYYALDGPTKGGASLQQLLISRGVLTGQTISSARGKVSRIRGII